MEAVNSKNSLPLLKIAALNLRHNTLLSLAVSAVLLLLTPVLFGTSNLDSRACAVPLEMFVALTGIVLLTPVFQPEQNQEIHDVVCSKYVSIQKIYMIRTLYSILLLTALILLSAAFMAAGRCQITPALVIGTVSDGIFLGSLGMLTAAVTNNTVIAYMIPLVFYTMNFGLGDKLGNFYLFSMTVENFRPKLWLLAIGLVLILASLFIKKVQHQLQ